MNHNGGNAPAFVGNISSLKPANYSDGLRMIREKLYRLRKQQKENIIPKQFSLSQNYPNPFNPATTIKFALPKDVNVTLKIYDLLGREVKTLVNEIKKSGYYEVSFDGSSLASGIYFYRLEAGTFVDTKKMVLVK